MIRFLILAAIVGVSCIPACANVTPIPVAGCVANAANNCTWANFSGQTAAIGDLGYYFAFRTATTAPTAPGSTTNLDTASASVSSFRSGCWVLTSATPATITATNATRIFVKIIHGTNATATANCVTLGIGFHTTAGASGTTGTYTFTGGPLHATDGSSLVEGAVGSSVAPCTPSSLTLYSANSSTDIFDNDSNGGVSSFATTTCAGTSGNWKTDTVEFLAPVTFGVRQCAQNEAGSITAITATFTAATLANSLPVIFAEESANSTSTVAITDSASQTGWTQAGSYLTDPTSSTRHAVWYRPNSGSLTTVTSTWSGSLSTFLGIVVCELVGADTGSPLDAGPATSTADAAAMTSGSLTTPTANDVLMYGIAGGSAKSAYVAGTDYGIATNGTNVVNAVQEKIVTATQTGVTTSMSWTTADNVSGFFLAFKKASAGGAVCTLSLLGAGPC